MAEIVVPVPEELTLDAITLRSPSIVNRSEWTGRRKVVGQPGMEVWTGRVSVAPVTTETAEKAWRAWLFALRGAANWFRVPLPCNQHTGTRPTVRPGAGNGYTLPLQGLPVSATVLPAGSWITVPLPSGRFRAVVLTAPLVSNSSGQGTATFEPALTETPATGATVETLTPFLPACAREDSLGLSMQDGVTTIGFDVEEYR